MMKKKNRRSMRFAISFCIIHKRQYLYTHTYTYTYIYIHAEPFRCRTMIINYNFSSIRDIESVEHTSEFFIPNVFAWKFSSLLFSARQLAEQTTEQ